MQRLFDSETTEWMLREMAENRDKDKVRPVGGGRHAAAAAWLLDNRRVDAAARDNREQGQSQGEAWGMGDG